MASCDCCEALPRGTTDLSAVVTVVLPDPTLYIFDVMNLVFLLRDYCKKIPHTCI